MREIKFRAWDGLRMTTSGIMFSTTGGIVFTAGGMPLMQYTGLKDKNGKEQYEGDIKNFGMYSPASYGRCLHIIYWNKEDACFNTRELGFQKQDGFPLGGEENEGEIIGNIHENSDLLNC